MHEYSVVQALIEQCEKIAQENEADRVTKVVVKIGVMSGVEPHLLETAFNTFKEEGVCAGSEFVLNVQNLVIACNECGVQKEYEKAHYCCDACQSHNVKVMDGEEMYLMSVELDV